jgi:uncharacterized protein (TIGR03435 family)
MSSLLNHIHQRRFALTSGRFAPESLDDFVRNHWPTSPEYTAWTNDERYDIVAKMPPGTYTPQQRSLMIRALLTDRFKLRTNKEMREIPIYALIQARSDKKLGPALHPTSLDCAAIRAKRAGSRTPTTHEELMECNFLTSSLPGGVQRLRAQGVSLTELAAAMGRFVDHPILDRAGLTGGFDLDLMFLPQVGGPAPGDQGDAPFIFNALQEQLGLKRRTFEFLPPTASRIEWRRLHLIHYRLH